MENMPNIPASLRSALQNGRVVPFVGSGVSLSVKPGLFPTWRQLLQSMATKLEEESKQSESTIVIKLLASDRLFEASKEAWQGLGKQRFYEVMRDNFGHDPDHSNCDLETPKAIWAIRPRIVVTTNYEKVLSAANPEARRLLNHQTAELATLTRDTTIERPTAWHLHGHIDEAETLILAPTHYESLYDSDKLGKYNAALERLRGVVADSVLLFVGFGFQDKYVLEMLRSVLDVFEGNLPPSFALMKSNSTGCDLWRDYNIETVEYDDHGAPLNHLLTQLSNLAVTTPTSSSSNSPPAPADGPDIPFCTYKSEITTYHGLESLLAHLEQNFSFRWEREAFEFEERTVVFWPVRLRAPTAIHAVQTFAVSLLQQAGAKVYLCLDDFGDSTYRIDRFHNSIQKWLNRTAGDFSSLEKREFSKLIRANDRKAAWQSSTEWLGRGRYELGRVLDICKISKAGQDTTKLFSRGTGRLLTPPTIWTCLDRIQAENDGTPLITLGGYDEKNLWESWRECTEIGPRKIGHLYLPELSNVHMQTTDLTWPSKENIENSLRTMSANEGGDWKSKNSSIPWTISGCVLLPSLAADSEKPAVKCLLKDDAHAEKMIVRVATEAAKWLL